VLFDEPLTGTAELEPCPTSRCRGSLPGSGHDTCNISPRPMTATG
jgi:hypothetical protein